MREITSEEFNSCVKQTEQKNKIYYTINKVKEYRLREHRNGKKYLEFKFDIANDDITLNLNLNLIPVKKKSKK